MKCLVLGLCSLAMLACTYAQNTTTSPAVSANVTSPVAPVYSTVDNTTPAPVNLTTLAQVNLTTPAQGNSTLVPTDPTIIATTIAVISTTEAGASHIFASLTLLLGSLFLQSLLH